VPFDVPQNVLGLIPELVDATDEAFPGSVVVVLVLDQAEIRLRIMGLVGFQKLDPPNGFRE
jgi:hypothetical protein